MKLNIRNSRDKKATVITESVGNHGQCRGVNNQRKAELIIYFLHFSDFRIMIIEVSAKVFLCRLKNFDCQKILNLSQ